MEASDHTSNFQHLYVWNRWIFMMRDRGVISICKLDASRQLQSLNNQLTGYFEPDKVPFVPKSKIGPTEMCISNIIKMKLAVFLFFIVIINWISWCSGLLVGQINLMMLLWGFGHLLTKQFIKMNDENIQSDCLIIWPLMSPATADFLFCFSRSLQLTWWLELSLKVKAKYGGARFKAITRENL